MNLDERDRTLIYTTGGGRLGNQLLNYANLLGFSLEHPEFDVVDLAFTPYLETYGTNLKLADIKSAAISGKWNFIVSFSWGGNKIRRIVPDRLWNQSKLQFLLGLWNQSRLQFLHGIATYSDHAQSIIGGNPHTPLQLCGDRFESFDLTRSERLQRLKSRQVSVVAGWGVRAWSLVDKYRDEIRTTLQVGGEYMSPARVYVEELRSQSDILVGVLVRQDDYRSWNDGRYFFDSETYRHLLDEFADEYKGETVTFLIASDEEQPRTLFPEDQFAFATGEAVGQNHYLESFAELSLCDVVMTPPSTFSTTAAFLGNVPVVPLYNGVKSDGWEYLESPLLDSLDHPEMSESVK